MDYSREETFNKLKEIVIAADESLSGRESEITESSRILQDLGFSSVELLYMAVIIEETFKIAMDDVNVWELSTVGDAVDMIMNEMKKQH
ncbi:MAG: acyl carrier protein [Clostridia bacterium]|nr:acyl carrier protein [Clostridia bacterium]